MPHLMMSQNFFKKINFEKRCTNMSRKSKNIHNASNDYMFYAMNDWFYSIYQHIPTAWLTQQGLFLHILKIILNGHGFESVVCNVLITFFVHLTRKTLINTLSKFHEIYHESGGICCFISIIWSGVMKVRLKFNTGYYYNTNRRICTYLS
jgi:hypothetical protein